MLISDEILCGQTHDHVMANEEGVLIHMDVAAPYVLMKQAASKNGIDIKIASGFRDFQTQKRIWDQKCQGKRALYDTQGKLLDTTHLSEDELLAAIFRWSAIPGGSRHHWGTEIDVFDAAQTHDGYVVKLIPEEALSGGRFEALNRWLEAHSESFGFFRPYQKDQGGVSPEWWHLSYHPVSQFYFENHSLELLTRVIRASSIEKKDAVLKQLPDWYERYFRNITPQKGK